MQICLRVGLATLLAAGAAAADTSRACALLAERHNNSLQPRRWVSYLGVPRPLAVWSIRSDPAQSALAHLLKLMLQHLLGYEDVVMRQLNTTRDALERLKNISHQLIPDEFVAVPGIPIKSSSLEEALANAIENDKTAFVRAYSRPPLRLQVNLTERAFADPRCHISRTDWLFFTNFTSGDCDFLLYDEIKNDLSEQWENPPEWCFKGTCAAVLVPGGHNARVTALVQQFISIQKLKLATIPPPINKNFYNNRSLLILSDGDSSLYSTYMLMHKHLAVYANRVARAIYHFFTLATYTDIAFKFSKTDHSLKSIEEDMCKYILENEKQINIWLPPEVSTVYVQYYLCHDDPNADRIVKAMDIVHEILQKKVSFVPRLLHSKLKCDIDVDATLVKEIDTFTRNLSWPSLGAVVVPRANTAVQIMARSQETLLLLYESSNRPSRDYPVFLSTAGWKSVTAAAVAWLTNKAYKRIVLKMENRSSEESEHIQKLLHAHNIYWLPYTKTTTAEILVLDADPDTAERLACDVDEDTSLTGLLLLREWSSRPVSCRALKGRAKRMPLSIWTVSGSWQGGGVETKLPKESNSELRQRLQHALGDNWPPQVAPMADAILTAGQALDNLRREYPQFMYDLHGVNVTSRLLSEIVRKLKVNGLTQSIQYTEGNMLAKPLVFVTYWENGVKPHLDAVIRVLTHTYETEILSLPENTIVDNTSSIQVTFYSVFTVLTIVIFCFIALKCWKARYQKLIAPSQWPVPAQLAAFEMRRDELEVHEKIGEGITGRVFLALWRGTHKLHVAVKIPVAGSDGAPTLLWEARIMASLQHPNVVRLLAIVSNGTPPLVVLEYAIRGDLRRYLAATERAAGGSSHVSPVLLTRLAREAAAALAYLASRNIVHRDVRAANCLIDEHHTLKLADFGMARELPREATEGVGINQYLCRRRALFPVLWMAPESLRRGVFSTATDMWSYGLLLIELVTMGARPFGNLTPSMVCCYVINGGIPLLPPCATFDMYNLARRCWARAADSRITAEQAQAFLERRRSALKPCAPVSLTPAFTLRSTSSLNEINFNSEINKDLMVCRACSI